MKLIQKAFLYKLEAEVRNGTLVYTQKGLLSKISKECNLYDFDDEVYESVYKDWGIGIIAAILFFLAGIIIIDIRIHSNTINNFLFYFIPAVILTILFFLTIRRKLYIDSRAGVFEFLYTEDALRFLNEIINGYKAFYKKYNIKGLTGKYFSEQLEEIKTTVDLQKLSRKELKEFIDIHTKGLLDCFCPICNKRKGINALNISTAFSILILTSRYTNIEIGCKTCLKEKVKKANIISLTCGIWSVPFGIPATLFIILKNSLSLKYLHMNIPTKSLKKYILNAIKKEKNHASKKNRNH